MTPAVTWRTVAQPVGRWLLNRLPTFILARYYSPGELEEDVKIRLASTRPVRVTLARKLKAPSFEIEAEAFNMSPYLDVHVKGVLSFLSADAEAGGNVFAELDDWKGFDLPRRRPRPFQLTYWLNEYQMAVVSTSVKEHLPIQVYVTLWAQSRIGVIHPFKAFHISEPAVR